MSKKDNVAAVPKYRFPEFALDVSINYVAGGFIFDPITNRNHHADLPILAITQEYGAIPRDEIDYKVSVTKKSLKAYKIVEKGDFIISLRSFQGGIEYSMYDGICSPAYIILRKKTNIIDQYYKYYFKSHRFIQDLNKDLEGIRDGKMISYGQFSSILLPKPDEEEQQKIADCLSSIDDLISVEEKKLSLLNDYKKGWMQKLFPAEGKTVPEWRFPEFSESWEVKSFKKYIKLYRGSSPRPIQDFIIKNNGINWIKISDASNTNNFYITNVAEQITEEGAKKSRLVEKGELILANSMSFGATYEVGISGCIYDGWFVLREYENNFIKKFLLQQLNSYEQQKQYSSLSAGGVVKNISSDIVYETILKRPSIKEQEKIANFLSGIDDLINKQTGKIEVLKQHKKALMQGLFPSIGEVL